MTTHTSSDLDPVVPRVVGPTESGSHFSSGVTDDGSGGAASVEHVAPEELEREHEVSISTAGESSGHLYDVWCETCGHVAPADTLEQAKAIARLHEDFIAVLADRWEVPE